jgi:hypothetical protein
MHERIEDFLNDVLRYQGKNSNVVREGVQQLLTAYAKEIGDSEDDPQRAIPAAHQFRKLCRDSVIEEIQQRTAIPFISHFQAVLSVIDSPAPE